MTTARTRPALSINSDGSFAIRLGALALLGARPAIDHEPILPNRVEIDQAPGHERIIYGRADGVTLELAFSHADGALVLTSTITGLAEAPHWVHPLACARLVGVERLYRTGIGFSGPTGLVPVQTMPEGPAVPAYPPDGAVNVATPQGRYGYESYLFTGLVAADGATLTVSTHEIDDFMLQCHCENRIHRHQFREREVARNAAYFEAGFSTERIPLPERRLRLPALRLAGGADAWTAMREAATSMGHACRARIPAPSYHVCTFYLRAEKYDRNDLEELLGSLDRDPEPLRTVQLDGGFCPFFGDWLEPHPQRFPAGLEEALRGISARGHVPGIWVGPFMVSNRSRIAALHPDWLLRWADGSRVVEWRHYLSTREDEEVYVLDTSHPEALAWIAGCFATMRRWGARFFKTDFLEWGWKDSTRVLRHAPGRTSMQYFRDFLRAVRGAIGEDSYWLGCISYFAPCVGFMDGMRVSSDVGIEWNDRPGGIDNDGTGGGTQNAVEEIYGCQFFNNVLWQNDPDSTFFRDYHIGMGEEEIFALAVWNGILGVSMNTADLARLPPSRRALWRFVRPQSGPWTARLPYLAGGSRLKVAVREFPALRAWAAVLLNDTRAAITERMALTEWIGHDSAHLFSWRPDGSTPLGRHGHWVAQVAGHSASLLFISSDGAPPPADLTLGGWRHG